MNNSNPDSSPASSERDVFVQRLTAAQSSLHAFIGSLMGGTPDVRDVLQQTNMVLWRRAAEYDAAREFLPWAYGLARYEVMAHRKRISRDRLLLDDDLLDRVAASAARQNGDLEERLQAMRDCVAKLPEGQRDLVRRRYADSQSVKAIAAELGQQAVAVRVLLYRIRVALAKCIKGTIAAGGAT